jgi:hypothetical protein
MLKWPKRSTSGLAEEVGEDQEYDAKRFTADPVR